MPHAATALATVAVALTCLAGSAGATEWTAQPGEKAGSGCAVQSSRQTMRDGYQQTSVYFTVTPSSFALVSAAPLDAGAGDIGLAVDAEPFVPMDRLDGEKIARFDSKAPTLIGQFKAGARVQVQLRFWPTWPATGAHSATLSLIGFTKAFDELARCR